MLRLSVGDTTYRISWFHEQGGGRRGPKGSSTCYVYAEQPVTYSNGGVLELTYVWNVVEHATVYCSRQDKFEKERGRKLSLAKAIRKFPRHVRAQFWACYHSRHLEPLKASLSLPKQLVTPRYKAALEQLVQDCRN